MKRLSRLALVCVIGSVAAGAQAFQYSILASGDMGLTGQSGGQTLTVGGSSIGNQADTTNGQIDFFPGNPGLVAGDSSGVGFRSYSFTYMVSAPGPIGGVGMVLLGSIGGTGQISLQEDVFRINADNSETLLGSMSNTLTSNGKADENGSYNLDGHNYTFVDNARFEPLARYKVKKSFFLQVTNWGTQGFNSANDFASIALIQQNHQPVPEPATMATLAIGTALIARRRRRS